MQLAERFVDVREGESESMQGSFCLLAMCLYDAD